MWPHCVRVQLKNFALLLHFKESRANPSLFTDSQVNGNTSSEYTCMSGLWVNYQGLWWKYCKFFESIFWVCVLLCRCQRSASGVFSRTTFFKEVAPSARLAGQQAFRSTYLCHPGAIWFKTHPATHPAIRWCWALNTGPHSPLASTLPTGPSLQHFQDVFHSSVKFCAKNFPLLMKSWAYKFIRTRKSKNHTSSNMN